MNPHKDKVAIQRLEAKVRKQQQPNAPSYD